MGDVFPIELAFNSLSLELILACNSTLISELVCYLASVHAAALQLPYDVIIRQ
jgi:hypothetical protein